MYMSIGYYIVFVHIFVSKKILFSGVLLVLIYYKTCPQYSISLTIKNIRVLGNLVIGIYLYMQKRHVIA